MIEVKEERDVLQQDVDVLEALIYQLYEISADHVNIFIITYIYLNIYIYIYIYILCSVFILLLFFYF